jgi:Amt family ammonium transporter
MKRFFTILALVGAVAIGAPAWADETPAGVSAASPAAAPGAGTGSGCRSRSHRQRSCSGRSGAGSSTRADNAWMMVCAALVILMSIPGLALFYGGLVRTKNMLSVLMQVFVTFSLISVLWVVYGYSLAFTEGQPSSARSTSCS